MSHEEEELDSSNQYKFKHLSCNEKRNSLRGGGFLYKQSLLTLLLALGILHCEFLGTASSFSHVRDVRNVDARMPDPKKWYAIMSRHTGMALDTVKPYRAAVYAFSYSDSQIFRFEKVADFSNIFRIIGSGKLFNQTLNVASCGSDMNQESNEIHRSPVDPLIKEQEWVLKLKPGNFYNIESRTSEKCIDLAARTKIAAEGDPILQWMCHGGLNQEWYIVPLC